MIGAATRFASAREAENLWKASSERLLGESFPALSMIVLQFHSCFFIAGTVSTHIALSEMSFRVAVQKGKALSKDYQATVTNCPTRT